MIQSVFCQSNGSSADLELSMTLSFSITKAKAIITKTANPPDIIMSKRRLTEPSRRNKIGIPMPNLPPKMVTAADKSWNACGPKSCNVSSESSREKQ